MAPSVAVPKLTKWPQKKHLMVKAEQREQRSLGVGELLDRSPQLQGERGGGTGTVPPCPPTPRCPPLTRVPPPVSHLSACDSPHQLPVAGDEDVLQLQQLKEVVCLQGGGGHMGTKPKFGEGGGLVPPAPTPNLVQRGPGRELQHDGLDGAVVPNCPHGGWLQGGAEGEMLIFLGGKTSPLGAVGASGSPSPAAPLGVPVGARGSAGRRPAGLG